MPSSNGDFNLLMMLVAIQTGVATFEELVAAGAHWVEDKSQPFDQLLVQRGVITEAKRRALLELMGPQFADQTHDERTQPRLPPGPSDRFQILGPWSGGGIGDVLRARDHELHREVAVKQIKDQYADDPERRGQFRNEAEITGGLEHPGVVPIYSLGSYKNGRPYYAMRLVHGNTLRDENNRFHEEFGFSKDLTSIRLPLRRLLTRFIAVCETMHYAHGRGVLHCDLKPGNILVGDFGETLIVDWGSARCFDLPEDQQANALQGLENASYASELPGTPAYMSPEQAAGDEQLSPLTDIYSLGATLYALLTGRSPFDLDGEVAKIKEEQGLADQDATDLAIKLILKQVQSGQLTEPRSIYASIPAALERICLRTMSVKPEDRFPSARQLSEAIESWLADEPIASWLADAERLEELYAKHPETPEYEQGLGRRKANLGLVLSGMGRLGEAESALREAVSRYESATGQANVSLACFGELIHTRQLLARVLSILGKKVDSERQMQLIGRELKRMADLGETSKVYKSYLESVILTDGPALDEVSDKLGLSIDPYDTPAYVAPPLADRQRVQARFKLTKSIAKTRMSSIWLADDLDLRRQVVLKQLVSEEPFAQRLFLHEARVTAYLHHANVPTVYGVGVRSEDKLPFFAMEQIEGSTLLQRLTEYHESEHSRFRNPNMVELLRCFASACETIEHAHKNGLLHGDAKPSNVVIENTGRVVVIDWGVSRVIDESLLPDGFLESLGDDPDEMGGMIGTPVYMSPEQAQGNLRELDARTDVYGLGAGLFQLLTGQLPFAGEIDRESIMLKLSEGTMLRPRDVDSSVPAKLDAICTKAIASRKKQRYKSAARLAAAIQSWLD